MRVLVTGGAGFIGRYLIPHLLQAGETAVSLLLLPNQPLPPHLEPFRPHLGLVYADLRDAAATARAVQAAAPDRVVHLAAVGATEPFLPVATAVAHNLHGTLNLLHACFAEPAPVQQFITARTPGEREAMNVYAASKTAVWQFCRMYAHTQGWPIHGAMIFQAYGPGQPENAFIPAALRAALAGQDFPMTAGTQARDWIYAADVAAGLGAILGADLDPGETIELGTGRATPLVEVAEMIYELVGRGGRPSPGALPSRPGETAIQTANAPHSRERIGWQAATRIRDGIINCQLQIVNGQ
jgi:nucleoside-diphosphate-sugar epimerase